MERIMYRSTNGISPPVDRRTAILESQPPDGGLYVPTYIPQFRPGEIKSLRGKKLSISPYQ
jgi:threonine synthase